MDNLYSAKDIRREVTLAQYLADQEIPMKRNRAVAVWRGGDGLSVALRNATEADGVWYDHVTSKGGSVIDLCMAAENVDYRTALATLGERYHIKPLTLREAVDEWNDSHSFRGAHGKRRKPTYDAEPGLVARIADIGAKAHPEVTTPMALAKCLNPLYLTLAPEVQTFVQMTRLFGRCEWRQMWQQESRNFMLSHGIPHRFATPGENFHSSDGWLCAPHLPKPNWNALDNRCGELPWWNAKYNCITRNPLSGKRSPSAKSYAVKELIMKHRYALLEFDKMEMDRQCAFCLGLRSTPFWPRVASIVFSGNKSLHILLKVEDMKADAVESWMMAHFKSADDEAEQADDNGFKAFGGMRLAGRIREETGEVQQLLYLSPAAGVNYNTINHNYEQEEVAYSRPKLATDIPTVAVTPLPPPPPEPRIVPPPPELPRGDEPWDDVLTAYEVSEAYWSVFGGEELCEKSA